MSLMIIGITIGTSGTAAAYFTAAIAPAAAAAMSS